MCSKFANSYSNSLFLALERAVTYSDNQELPSNWEREELLGTDEEDFSDEEEVGSFNINQEVEESKECMYKQLIKSPKQFGDIVFA